MAETKHNPTGRRDRLAAHGAPSRARDGLCALFALDTRLGTILRATREPLLGQMRLTWWHDALRALDYSPAPAEPILAALAAEVLPNGVSGHQLAGQIDGWEALLDDLDEDAMTRFAAARGGNLFKAAAALLRAGDANIALAGEGWALADLAANLSDPAAAERARLLAADRFRGVFSPRWSRAGRPLGAMALMAEADMTGRSDASRLVRLLRHRMTGG
jgi:phytoene synthase